MNKSNIEYTPIYNQEDIKSAFDTLWWMNNDLLNILTNNCNQCENGKKITQEILDILLIDKKTWLPNEQKFQNDIINEKWDKLIWIIKINNFKHINSFYSYTKWDEILWIISNEIKQKFWKIWFKVYKTTQLNYWLLLDSSQYNKIKENTIQREIEKIISKFEINTEYWKMGIKLTWWIVTGKIASYDQALSALYSDAESWVFNIYNDDIEKELFKESSEIIEWTKRIREWLEKNHFQPYYQWIYNNHSKEFDKYEALVRYTSKDKKSVPWEFLWVAKTINLLWEISKKLIENVISEMRYHEYCIWINLTEEDLRNKNLIKLIINNLDFYWIESQRLTVEVLENVTGIKDDINTENTVLRNINVLKKNGIQISIDDFGTWHSNFARLTQLSPDYLKIDGSLVKWIISKDKKQAKKYTEILRSIIEFWHLHNAKVIAEFVENQEIQDILELLWVDYSQWYLFSKPSRDIIEK